MGKISSKRYINRTNKGCDESKRPSSSDVWDFRRNWNKIKEVVIEDFAKDCYRLSVQKKITLSTGEIIAL